MSARHDFEQVVFIGWLSNKILSEYVLHSTIGVYPNENIGGLSIVLLKSVCPNIYIYIYIYIYIGGWSNILSEFVQQTFTRTKTKTFCFRYNFHTWQKCTCKGVGEDSGHGAWLIHVENCIIFT